MSYSYALEHARSGRAKCTGRCRKEGKLIPMGVWRFGSVLINNDSYPMTYWRYEPVMGWVELKCMCVPCV